MRTASAKDTWPTPSRVSGSGSERLDAGSCHAPWALLCKAPRQPVAEAAEGLCRRPRKAVAFRHQTSWRCRLLKEARRLPPEDPSIRSSSTFVGPSASMPPGIRVPRFGINGLRGLVHGACPLDARTASPARKAASRPIDRAHSNPPRWMCREFPRRLPAAASAHMKRAASGAPEAAADSDGLPSRRRALSLTLRGVAEQRADRKTATGVSMLCFLLVLLLWYWSVL